MTSPDTPTPAGTMQLSDLVARCVEAADRDGTAAIEAILSEYPELAEHARRRLEFLQRAGLLGDAPSPGVAGLPRTIGPYKVLEHLGSGGMGEVYLARQSQPVLRRVAVKIVKLGTATRDVIARFELERQALALMSHANIARVFDAGSTDGGQPYFVMEYVPGLPIVDYANGRKLSTDTRLELFLQLCEGVQHAHHKGVIHRDLKPSNVLVVEQDGRPAVKIIDFGVAKAIAFGDGGATLHTRRGVMLGTPEYVSPEQAAGDPDIDTRTDVYSLGAILYELLTGCLPHDSARLRAMKFDEMLGVIRDEEPVRPSTRVTPTDPATTEHATARGTDTETLRRRLRGDLDWIVLKALAKDRSRRYATPNELAADIRRYLGDEPIAARPPSAGYRFRKFARRYRAQLVLATLLLLALIAGLVMSLSFYVSARNSAENEARARVDADAHFDRAIAAVDEMLRQVGETTIRSGATRIDFAPTFSQVRAELLARALAFYDDLLASRSDSPTVKLRIAMAHDRVGAIQGFRGDLAAAEKAHRAAIAAYGELAGEYEVLLGAASARAALAEVLFERGAIGDSRIEFDAALAALVALAAKGDSARRQLARVRRAAGLAADVIDPSRSAELLRGAVGELETLVASQPDDPDLAVDLAATLSDLLGTEIARGTPAAADQLLARAIATAQRAIARDPNHLAARVTLADLYGTASFVGWRRGEHDAALRDQRRAADLWRELGAEFPEHPAFALSLHYAEFVIARHLPFTEALPEFRRLIAELEKIAGARPESGPRSLLAHLLVMYSDSLTTEGGDDLLHDARSAVSRAEELARALVVAEPGISVYARRLGEALLQRADVETRAGDAGVAQTALERACAVLAPLATSDSEFHVRFTCAKAHWQLARARIDESDHAGALRAAAAGLAAIADVPNGAHPPGRRDRRALHAMTAMAHCGLGDHAAALPHCERWAALADRGDHLYFAARELSRCLALTDDQAARARYSATAIAWLEQARVHPLRSANLDPRTDPMFEPLRHMSGFPVDW